MAYRGINIFDSYLENKTLLIANDGKRQKQVQTSLTETI